MLRTFPLFLTVVVLLNSGCRSVNPLAKFEDSMVYAPAAYPKGNWQPRGLAFEDAWFTAKDGTKLHGWYCDQPFPRAVVLFAHGNAGNLSDRAERLRQLHDNYHVAAMTFDYRGPVLVSHGDADGVIPFEQGQRLYEAAPGRKRFVRIPGGDHNDPQSQEWERALEEFFVSLPPPAKGAVYGPAGPGN